MCDLRNRSLNCFFIVILKIKRKKIFWNAFYEKFDPFVEVKQATAVEIRKKWRKNIIHSRENRVPFFIQKMYKI